MRTLETRRQSLNTLQYVFRNARRHEANNLLIAGAMTRVRHPPDDLTVHCVQYERYYFQEFSIEYLLYSTIFVSNIFILYACIACFCFCLFILEIVLYSYSYKYTYTYTSLLHSCRVEALWSLLTDRYRYSQSQQPLTT